METAFTPIAGLIGGALIGAAAVIFMALLGRIAGISGIVAGVLAPPSPDTPWRVMFIAGLILGAAAARASGWGQAPMIAVSWPILVIGGLLVGIGTRIGGGCTSGHGVCGIARLSTRSVVATLAFMLVAMGVVYARRHLAGMP
jgi:uncharacterized membrane protein YedE/YeeE